MATNRGKQFEAKIREAFERVDGVSIDRIHDQTTRYKGSTNICDFIVYKEPYEYYIECKSVHGNTLSIYGKDEKHKYGNITNGQWEGLLEKSKIQGVRAGVICWFVDKDVTEYIPIQALEILRNEIGEKSLSWGTALVISNSGDKFDLIEIDGKKKRVFFEYDMNKFFKEVKR